MNSHVTEKTPIILVYPNYIETDPDQIPSLPLGLGYIAQSIVAINETYEIVDLNIDSTEDLFKLISSEKPKFLAISLMSYKYQISYNLLKTIKTHFPDLIIIAGGPHLTTNLSTVLEECQAIDIGVVGEGEITIQEIIQGKPLEQIQGVIFRKRSQIIFTGTREYIQNLDFIPFPLYDKFKLKCYGNAMVLNSSRGCPYHCIFCGGPKILGNKWRKRSASSMFEELNYWYLKGYRKFLYSDSNFGLDKNRVIKFCELLAEKTNNIRINADGLRADHFNKELLEKMWNAGFRSLTFGVESGSEKVLNRIKKGESLGKIDDSIKIATEIGFETTLFFIIGSPSEGIEDIEKSFSLAKKYNIARVHFFNLTPIPGTEYYDWVVENNLIPYNLQKYPDEKFGFSDNALLPNDILTKNQLSLFIKKARRIERQIYWRYQIQKIFQKLFLGPRACYRGQFTKISWIISLPIIDSGVRFIIKIGLRCKNCIH